MIVIEIIEAVRFALMLVRQHLHPPPKESLPSTLHAVAPHLDKGT